MVLLRVKDLRELPQLTDGYSYLYVEHCKVDREHQAIAIHDASGRVPVPCAALALLMLGPGTSITHAAVLTLADNGCLVAWCGEHGTRFYAQGLGKNRSSRELERQARLWSDPEARLRVVRRMYEKRFGEPLSPDLTLRQIRGREGLRVRSTYAEMSEQTGVPWSGRSYKRDSWKDADPVNRALSTANSCLYGVCHAGIVALGYSPGLGFIHTGKQLSFVYDIADLYKTEVTIPIAFYAAAEGVAHIESEVRHRCRDAFVETRLLKRIVSDIEDLLGSEQDGFGEREVLVSDPAAPGAIWDPDLGEVSGGVNYDESAGWEDE